MKTTTTALSTVLGGVDTLTTLMGDVMEIMVANPILVTCLAASLLCVAIRIFRKFKGAAR